MPPEVLLHYAYYEGDDDSDDIPQPENYCPFLADIWYVRSGGRVTGTLNTSPTPSRAMGIITYELLHGASVYPFEEPESDVGNWEWVRV